MANIELNNVSKIFPGGSRAIDNISFTIHDGEFFILVGPSGCGKSTLLNMIVGLEEISRGEIRVDGKLVNDLDPKDRNMAMVFQSYALYPHMTVRENMAFPLTMAKVSKQEIKQRVEEAAKLLELTPLLERKPRNLSGGQRQRVAMGRAIVRKPDAFLLDEPLSNLDARLRVQMRTEIARLQKRLGTTTIYVTHDQTEAMTLGDRVAVLKHGVIQQIGTPTELYMEPSNIFVATFIGSPAMNLFPAQVRNGRLFFPLLDADIQVPKSARIPHETDTLIAGLRPEHFYVETHLNQQNEHVVFDTTVDVVEWLGADILVYFQKEISNWPHSLALEQEINLTNQSGDKLDFVVRLSTAHSVKENNTLKLAFDANDLHLFDPETGECLTSARG
ncbi:ABC transporter ATP-binding protein [Kaarinaea lacus]